MSQKQIFWLKLPIKKKAAQKLFPSLKEQKRNPLKPNVKRDSRKNNTMQTCSNEKRSSTTRSQKWKEFGGHKVFIAPQIKNKLIQTLQQCWRQCGDTSYPCVWRIFRTNSTSKDMFCFITDLNSYSRKKTSFIDV